MKAGDQLVPRDSPAYQEFARLYRLARTLRPSTGDRWSGNLAATPGGSWGGFEPLTGDIRLSGPVIVRHLANLPAATAAQRAEVLVTVLHEATHASMETDAPDEPNAVRTPHSLGLMEGFAEVRAMEDFDAFARRAGHSDLELPQATYPGAHAATDSLLDQASGLRTSRTALIDDCCRGPGAMHFDQLADAVTRNRLAEVVPFREDHQRAVRAALIATMVHPGWPILQESSRPTGEKVAQEIGQKLNSKVDEIRRHYYATPGEVFPVDSPNAQAGRERVLDRAQGASEPRGQAGGPGNAGVGSTGPGNAGPGRAGPGRAGPGNTEPGHAGPGSAGPGNVRPGSAGVGDAGREDTESGGGMAARVGDGRDGGGDVPAIRFLDGQAGAAGAVQGRPVLGDGARGRGTGEGNGQGCGAGPRQGPASGPERG